MFLVWCHRQCIQPIENALKKYNKEEPNESKWIQIYCLSSSLCVNELGLEEEYYTSHEKYFYPYTKNFLKFVENEHTFFIDNQIKIDYDADYFQEPELMESLFIVKTNSHIIVKSYPVLNEVKKLKWNELPEMSNKQFAFIEYTHPQMLTTIELILPDELYVVGNDILSSAYILKQLELKNCYYVFDRDYVIHIMDHDLESIDLLSDEYVEITLNGYNVKKCHNESVEKDDESIEEKLTETEEMKRGKDDDSIEEKLTETEEMKRSTDDEFETEIVYSNDLDNSSTYSETTTWWSFIWGSY
jgi:hypothetical protein